MASAPPPPKGKLIFAPGVSSTSPTSSTLDRAFQPSQSQPQPPAQPVSTIDPSSTTSNATASPNPNAPSSQTQPTSLRAAQFHAPPLHLKDLDPSPLHQFATWFSALPPSSVPETCVLSTASLPSGRVSSRYVYLKEVESDSPPSSAPAESSTAGGGGGGGSSDASSASSGAGGFVIYSHFGPHATSLKARDLASNEWVSLAFWWKDVERQVRVEGKGELLTREESERYWRTRERGSRIGAWASRQSQVLGPRREGDAEGDDGRDVLDERVREAEKKFGSEEEVSLPPWWGGLRVRPVMVEFWQGRESRLHDRFRYTLREDREEGDCADDQSKEDARERKSGKRRWKIERLSP